MYFFIAESVLRIVKITYEVLTVVEFWDLGWFNKLYIPGKEEMKNLVRIFVLKLRSQPRNGSFRYKHLKHHKNFTQPYKFLTIFSISEPFLDFGHILWLFLRTKQDTNVEGI